MNFVGSSGVMDSAGVRYLQTQLGVNSPTPPRAVIMEKMSVSNEIPDGDATTRVASTQWVQDNTNSIVSGLVTGVSSVFGRDGAVVAVSGDYSADLVTNAADKASASAQIFSGPLSTGPASATLTGSQTAGWYIGTNGNLFSFAPGTTVILQGALTTDTQARFGVNTSGLMQWGAGGATAPDTIFGRIAVGELQFGSTTQGNALRIFQSATGNFFLRGFILSEGNPRFTVSGDGTISWGAGGGSAVDTTWSRLGANIVGTSTDSISTGPTTNVIGLGGVVGAWIDGTNGYFLGAHSSPTVAAGAWGATTDTVDWRFWFDHNGKLTWGSGAVARDTTLERIAANKLQATNTGVVSSSSSVGMGYSTGAGSTVTQATSRSTGVTINAMCGNITTNNTSLAAGASVTFTVTNSSVALGDVIILNMNPGLGPNAYTVSNVVAGSFKINYTNNNAGSDITASSFHFAIIKAVTA